MSSNGKPDTAKLLVNLAMEFVKYQAKKQLGDSFLTTLAESVTDYAGERTFDKLTDFLGQGGNAQQILDAFQEADGCFANNCNDIDLKQAIVSKPLRSLPELETLARSLTKTLDDAILHQALRAAFQRDWPKLSGEQLDTAANVYGRCLDRALAAKCDQLLPTMFRKVVRIEETSAKTLEGVGRIEEIVTKLLESAQSLQLLVTQQSGTGRATVAQQLSSGILPDDPPLLHKLDEYTFQRLCQALFEKEPNIATCSEYGIRGQSQKGIDLIAYRVNGDGTEVVQCKCYEEFEPKLIRDASDAFLNHWPHWSDKDVKRFVLIVSCELSTVQRQDEIVAQRKRFAAIGLVYEVWPIRTIISKLRPHPSIVASYLSPPDLWVKRICGDLMTSSMVATPAAPQTTILVPSTLTSQDEQLSSYTSSEIAKRLEEKRAAWQAGRRTEVNNWLSEVKTKVQVWNSIDPAVRAKILLFEAGIVLDTTGNVDAARQLADAALDLSPGTNQVRLRAWIAYLEHRPEAALALLEDLSDTEGINLRATFLLQLGRIDESLAVLDRLGEKGTSK